MVRRLLLLLIAFAAAIAFASCGDDSDGERRQGDPAAARSGPAVKIVRPDNRSRTAKSRVRVEGTVADGARIEVDGRPARIEGPATQEGRSRWVAVVPLERGRNVIEVVATLGGVKTTDRLVVVRDGGSGGGSGGSGGSGSGGGSGGGSSGNQGGAGGDQGGSAGDEAESGGSQGGSGGSQGGSGGSQGGSGGSQGGSGGSQGGNQGGPPAAPPEGGNQGGGPGNEGGQGGQQAGPGEG